MPSPMPVARPVLRLVVSRPAARDARPSADLCRSVAVSVADRFRGVWVPAGTGPAEILVMLGHHVADGRGFDHPDDVQEIVATALRIITEREAAARLAFRRPPRRRRPRAILGEQFILAFGVAA